ncbi:MAG: hypothetical protein SV775_01785 [Thermodesulfobacteriota bacterium]|nr:hypothetical protein [Thermodesulfobacteriota bacterium]
MVTSRHFRRIDGLIFLVVACSLIACTSFVTDCRKYAFSTFQRGFGAIDDSPYLHEVVDIKNIKVHIVGHRRFFTYDDARNSRYGIVGYATKDNEIYVFGKVVKGKIILNQAVLGHELNHLLNFRNPDIADPDRLDELGT